MRLLADENVVPAHISALESAGYDIRRIEEIREKGVTDTAVLATAREQNRVILTYDKKDFATVADHPGVLLADETTNPRALRRAVRRIERAYPELADVTE